MRKLKLIRKGDTGFNTADLFNKTFAGTYYKPQVVQPFKGIDNKSSSYVQGYMQNTISDFASSNNINLNPTPVDKPDLSKINPSSLDEKDTKGGGFKSFMQSKGNLIGQIADMANSASDAIFGQKRGMNGPNAGLTSAIDNTYNQASDFAMKLNPAVGGIMKVAGFVGNTLNKAGGGTDGMTTQDAVLNSAPLTLATLGLNGFLGDTTESFTKNEEAFAQVGASYGGTGDIVADAMEKANKKYGLLSGGARTEANRLIRKAKMQQNVMADIGADAQDAFAIQGSMAAINGNRRAFQLQGGYDQSAIRVGRYGMILRTLEDARDISKKQISENILPEFKEGGSLSISDLIEEIDIDNISSEFRDDIIKEIDLDNILPEFKEGGKFNIIPEGALHARKHNMDVEGITKKGIPVVSQSEGGEIQQQAEIERQELILRLEVTKKIEELAKDGSDEAAIEAGKLLVKEILYNTIDNTNSLI